MDLNIVQLDAISALKDNEGYRALLGLLKMEIDHLLEDLYLSDNEFKRKRILNLWEATKWILNMLSDIPEDVSRKYEEKRVEFAEEELKNSGFD